ncbi:MAG: type II secretion system F family protein [Gammaproteobacteria bacterium]|nr:MAG: type II secretion system F family protein [Gammaproteobacteria bacterium]
MATFRYTGRDPQGERIEGREEATSAEALASLLMGQGITPLQIEPVESTSGSGPGLGKFALFQPRVTLDELIIFCRQMYALSKAGIPIIRAMRGLAESTRSEALAETLHDVSRRLESGVNLATSMNAHPKVFNDLFVAMIHVGENTGQLDDAFKQLADNLELERETRKRVKQAVRYPIMVVVALFVALMVVNYWVIPAFAGVFAKLGADLPLATKILIASSDFFIDYGWLVILLVVAGGLGFYRWVHTPEGRLTWDRKRLKFPIIGPLFELVALSRFARNFAMMLKAGMPIVHALSLVAEAVNNAYLGQAIKGMRTGIERGDTLLRTARQTEMFSPLVLQMLAVGEETGQIDSLLLEVADFYDEEVDYQLKRLSESIEPILLVFTGILVLILALGVFLPMWDMGRAAIGG